jgi:hypothetical protein
LKPVKLTNRPIEYAVSSGDKVRIRTTDGKGYNFKVISVDADMVVGKDVEILTKDILSVEVQEDTSLKKSLTTLLIVVASVALLGYGLYDEVTNFECCGN